MLNSADGTLKITKIIDILPEKIQCSDKALDILKTTKPSETGNLPSLLKLKVMFIPNIDIYDRLINRQIGNAVDVKFQGKQVTPKSVRFDDDQARSRKMATDAVSKSYRGIPIERSEASFNLRKKLSFH